MIRNLIKYVRNEPLGTITVTCSLLFVFLGMPTQIWTIFQTENVGGISPGMFTLLGLQSFLWVLYGRKKRDWIIIVPNFFIAVFAAIIVFQYFRFL
ncbi:MAG: hypothetical protein HYT98_00400 [Candidatus Sungbacteria bacterium]|nr:hypothetical protein [Candidatus Sungbacteria bacterium]